MDFHRQWELLSMATPPMRTLAGYYSIGTSAEAENARNELDQAQGGREPFYAMLFAELQVLERNIEASDRVLPPETQSLRRCIRRVLEVFEIRCSPKVSGRRQRFGSVLRLPTMFRDYPNLERLEQLAICARQEGRTIIAQNVMRVATVVEKRPDARKQFISRLRECNQCFPNTTPTFNGWDETLSSLYSIKNSFKYYTDRQRNLMYRVYNLLNSPWDLEEHLGRSDVRLLLDPHPRHPARFDAQLDLWFRISSSSSGERWQEADLFVYQDEWSDEYAYGMNIPLKNPNSKGKSPMFQDVDLPATPPKENGFGDMGTVRIPELVHEMIMAKLNEPRRLHLVVKQSKMQYLHSKPATFGEAVPTFGQLQALISGDTPSFLSQQSGKAKYILAFIMASSFLQFHETPWCQRWTKEQIFFITSEQRGYDICQPYISTRLQQDTHLSTPSKQDALRKKFQLHPYPDILALGIMLVQIWLGQSIEDLRPPDNRNRNATPQDYDIEADMTVASNLILSCKDNTSSLFDMAVNACLNVRQFTPGQSLRDENFRKQIYRTIVWPIETILTFNHGVRLEEENALRSGLAVQIQHVSQRHSEVTTTENLQQDDGESSQGTSTTKGMRDVQILPNVDTWMQDLGRYVHPLLAKTLQETSPPFRNSVIDRSDPVRIAILDTGIDLPRPAYLAFGHRVKKYKDWVNGGIEGTPWVDGLKPIDLEGHGTHAAALILKGAPQAELYVARVFPPSEKNNVKNGTRTASSEATNGWIVEAIYHAINEWNVDIISMSFGFERGPLDMDSAIMDAYRKNVIMFAAAGNGGGNSDPPYPGRLTHVIAIHAADDLGNKAPFTANLQRRADNFSFPGTNVESSWPIHLNLGNKTRKSGTSCATPIAAALAANILEITGLQFHRSLLAGTSPENDEPYWRKNKSYGGMRVAFDLMSSDRDQYQYTTPWTFFPPGHRRIETAMETLIELLIKKL